MITKKRYKELQDYLKSGANLPSINLTQMYDFEKQLKIRVVTDWISYDEAENKDEAIGGLGGFFNFGMRWIDYAGQFTAKGQPYAEAIRESILQNNIRITGAQHQTLTNGVPLFDDGKVGIFSYRAWGDIMAAIWSEKENKDYNYMDFYM